MMNVLEMMKNNKKLVGLAGAAAITGIGALVLRNVLSGGQVESDEVDDCDEDSEETETEAEEEETEEE